MTVNTLGIIGKGHLVANFFDYLINSSSNSCLDSHDENIKKSFFRGVDRLLFLNYGYESNDLFKQSKGFKNLKSKLNGKIAIDVVDSFKSFIINSNVVLDAAGGYISRWDNPQYDLFSYGQDLSNLNIEGLSLPNLNRDYKLYSSQLKEKGRIIMDKETFEKEWILSFEIIKSVARVDEKLRKDLSNGVVDNSHGSAIGFRMYTEFPFTASMMKERGIQMQMVTSSGYVNLPSYLIVVNEPCTAANIFTSQCPLMTSRTVACTGFDLERLEHVLNDEYAVLKEQKGYKDYILRVSLAGFHDTEMMIPIILPQNGDLDHVLAKIFDDLDYEKAYEFLKKETGAYYVNPKHDTKISDEQVSRHLLRTIVGAMRSQGKALSIYPSLSERSLSNGYYHDVVEQDKGMFLVGDHRFVNGKVKVL